MSDQLPYVPEGLVEYLDRLFPNTMPDVLNSTPERVAFMAGSVHVVRKLRDLQAQSVERSLSPYVPSEP